MMVIHRFWSRVSAALGVSLPVPIATALTFTGVTLGWGLFAMDITRVGVALERIVRG